MELPYVSIGKNEVSCGKSTALSQLALNPFELNLTHLDWDAGALLGKVWSIFCNKFGLIGVKGSDFQITHYLDL